ncbi:MAG: TIR domain-containing protein [Deltaproteobacteria bacterium]
MPTPRKTRVFISFDYDRDQDLKNLLVGQSRHKDSPFFIEDWSIKEETKGWKADARKRIRLSSSVIVICGHHTHQAVGVTTEVAIARGQGIPVYLLKGRKSGWVRKPRGCFWDTMHVWTHENLRDMTTGKL